MSINVLQCVVLLHTLLCSTHAFWWPPPTTTARSTAADSDCSSESPATVLKQIPLTYFRTYTYQPMPGNPFGFPYYSSPLLTAPRYEPYLTPNYASKYTPMNPLLPQEPLLAAKPALHSGAYETQTIPPTKPTTTTTSTTTTTTPAPTTTTSTTTTTTAPLPPPMPTEPLINGYTGYPTYNRRAYLGATQYPYRPHYPYPYPEYSLYKPQAQSGYAQNGNAARVGAAHIQFVPCMCPVSVANNGLHPMGAPTAANYLAQARNSDIDDDMLADEEVTDDEDKTALPAAETEMKNEDKSKVTIEAEVVEQSEVKKPLEMLTGQLTSNKIDVELHAQADSETGV